MGEILVNQSTLSDLPSIVKCKLAEMTAVQQNQFVEEYNRKKKSVGYAYFFLLICLGIPYGYLGKWGLQLVYWLTGGGFFIWMIYLIFKLPDLVRDYNKDVALDVIRDISALSA